MRIFFALGALILFLLGFMVTVMVGLGSFLSTNPHKGFIVLLSIFYITGTIALTVLSINATLRKLRITP